VQFDELLCFRFPTTIFVRIHPLPSAVLDCRPISYLFSQPQAEICVWRLAKYILETRPIKTFFIYLSFIVNKGPARCNSMQTFIHCHVTLHVSGVTHPSSGVLKTVSSISGVCHGNGSVTSFHRGLIRIRPRWKEVTVPLP